MGLLDDAIREHLELKRRRGADAAEISRLESEALAPVRRSADGVPDMSDTYAPGEPPAAPAAAPPASLQDETTVQPAAVPPSAFDASARTAEHPAPYEPPALPEPPLADEEPAEAPSLLSRLKPSKTRLRLGRDRFAPLSDEPGPEPPPPSPPPPPPPSAGHQLPPPGAYDTQPSYQPPPPPSYAYTPAPPPLDKPDVVPAGEEPDVEDLLEETPEFLEETPEHDRLWFEQRPPRDFDFDG